MSQPFSHTADPLEWYGVFPPHPFHPEDPFTMPEGRIVGGAMVVLTDSHQEAAFTELTKPFYNAYLMSRGCVISEPDQHDAQIAYDASYGANNPLVFHRSVGPDDVYNPRRCVVPIYSVPPPPCVKLCSDGVFRHVIPANFLAQDHPFRQTNNRISADGPVCLDAEQEAARAQLSAPLYNAYLFNRGCVIPPEDREVACRAFMATYGVGSPPPISIPMGPSAMVPPPLPDDTLGSARALGDL